MTLEHLNAATETEVRHALLSCCGSQLWAERLLALRPFATREALDRESESIWESLSSSDWLQAFASHPKIGERSSSEWSAQEQNGMQQASADLVDAIRDLNADYEGRFGYKFIVCASGKSAAEMLSLLSERLGNKPQKELQIAAAEQAKITRLRLQKLLTE